MHINKMCLSLIIRLSHVSIAVATIIRVTYKNIRNSKKFVSICKWTTYSLQI